MRRLACIFAVLFLAAPAVAACPGDCNGDGVVVISELVKAVGIALGSAPVGDCPAVNTNGDAEVTIAELIAATNALLSGCPSVTPSMTAPPAASATPTESPTASPTATVNRPPLLATPFVYRGIAGQAIARPIGAADPEGGPVACASNALLAGMTLDSDNILNWTPADGQLGLFSVPVQCQDAAEPPLAASGDLDFRIAPMDPCTTPVCDPASGCTATAPAVDHSCCTADTSLPRLPESEVSCPQGRLLQIGRNAMGFGSLQSCDFIRFRQSAQTSASLRFHVRVSCVSVLNRVTITAHLETDNRGVLVDGSFRVSLPTTPINGFYERRNIDFPFLQDGPFLNIEDREANLTVSVTDDSNVTVSETVRVRLTSDPLLPDLSDP